jgi:hypothetical protein
MPPLKSPPPQAAAEVKAKNTPRRFSERGIVQLDEDGNRVAEIVSCPWEDQFAQGAIQKVALLNDSHLVKPNWQEV